MISHTQKKHMISLSCFFFPFIYKLIVNKKNGRNTGVGGIHGGQTQPVADSVSELRTRPPTAPFLHLTLLTAYIAIPQDFHFSPFKKRQRV